MKCKIHKNWITLEKEHTKSSKMAKKIVNDHLKEFGCRYYPALIKMEKKLMKRR
jgi:hypothetical protein